MILIRSLGKITLLPQRFAFSSSNLHDVPPMIRKVQEKIKILTPQNTPNLTKNQIDEALRNIAVLQQKNQEKFINLVLAVLSSRKASIQLFENNYLKSQFSKFPSAWIQLNMAKISILKKQIHEAEEKQKLEQKINDIFLESFNKVLPRITNQKKESEAKALLFKNFGNHLTTLNKNQKAEEFFKRSLVFHKKLILDLAQNLQKNYDATDLNKQERTELQLRKSAEKQNTRRILQSMMQVLFAYYKLKSPELKALRQKQKIKDKILQMLVSMNEYLRLKSVIPGIQHFSLYYHRLCKIELELQYTVALYLGDTKKVNNVITLMQNFSKQCLQDLKKVCEYPIILREVTLSLVVVQIHLIKHFKPKEKLREEIIEFLSEVLNNVEAKYHGSIKKFAKEVIKQHI